MQSALEAVGMLDVPLDTEVRSLSGGYKRRLALAIQLVRDPHVLCLDEPLAGLDWKARADVVALLDALRRVLGLVPIRPRRRGERRSLRTFPSSVST